MIDRPGTAAGNDRPIAGRRVLVPRPSGRADDLARLLRQAGATPCPIPLIEIRPESDSAEVRRAVADAAAGAFDWVAFTSVAAVMAMRQAVGRPWPEHPIGDGPRIAAVGAATAAALRRAGIAVDLVPDGAGSANALIAAWPREPRGRSVLLPRSDRARRDLPDALRSRGYRVREVVAYRTVTLPASPAVAGELAAGRIDAVLLTSPSTAAALTRTRLAPEVVVVAIGASTAAAARDAGIAVTATATEPTPAGLVAALAAATGISPRR